MSKKIGSGVFTWDGQERRSDRYGAFVLDHSAYSGERVCEVALDMPALRALAGRRVRLVAVVLEARKSGHVGDLTHEIYPSTPEVGERVELGVGELRIGRVEWPPNFVPSIELVPSDGRKVFWIDPRKLYRLHDQTVEIYAEETEDAPHAAPDLKKAEREVRVAVASEGSFQYKNLDPERDEVSIAPEVRSLGGGMFAVNMPVLGDGKHVGFNIKRRGK